MQTVQEKKEQDAASDAPEGPPSVVNRRAKHMIVATEAEETLRRLAEIKEERKELLQ